MIQIRNFGFITHVQKSHVSDTPHESSRNRQHARLAKGDEPAFRHSGHSAPHGQGFGGYVLVGYGCGKCADRAVCHVQIPASAGTPTATDQLFRRMGGHIHEKDLRLRVERNGRGKTQRTFPNLHQSPGIGDVPAGDYRLSYRQDDKPRHTERERALPFPRTYDTAKRHDRASCLLCT